VTLRLSILIGFVLAIVFLFSSEALSQAPSSASGPQAVFVFVQRASSHAKYSKAEVFHAVLDDVMGYLKQKNVAMASDEFGNRTHSEDEMPLATVQGIARDSGATYLLYALVERPVTKWIKVTVRCYDMAGQQLWQEEAASGGGLSGGHGLSVTLDRLHDQLDKRIGQAGLPLAAPVAGSTQTVSQLPQ
jgi:hypothetical protein